MRMIPMALTVLAIAMIATIVWRISGTPIGPRTYAFMVATAIVIIAALMSWRRPPTGTTTTSGRV